LAAATFTAVATALRATCCDLVLTKNRLKNRRALVAKIETQMAAVWQQLPLPQIG